MSVFPISWRWTPSFTSAQELSSRHYRRAGQDRQYQHIARPFHQLLRRNFNAHAYWRAGARHASAQAVDVAVSHRNTMVTASPVKTLLERETLCAS
jgi:hypothetical protein